MMKKQHSHLIKFSILASTVFVATTLAAPPGNPPNANVSPTFSGLKVNNGAQDTLVINSNGQLNNPTNQPIQFVDVEGISSTGAISNQNFRIGSNGWLSNPVAGNTPVTVADNNGFVVSNNTNSLGLAIEADGDLTTLGEVFSAGDIGSGGEVSGLTLRAVGNITSGGSISSQSGIGRFYTLNSTPKAINAGTPASPTLTLHTQACQAGDRAVSCSITGTNAHTFLNDSKLNNATNSCAAYAANTGPAGNFSVSLTCFDPQG